MEADMRIAVTGAGGFIGHHLVKRLKEDDHWVRGIDLKRPEWEDTEADQWMPADLRHRDMATLALSHVDQVYALAADMGGIGYITSHHADIMANNTRITLATLDACRDRGVRRVLYTSSACVYPVDLQAGTQSPKLSEHMAWPANPEEGYGLEKLYSEKLCQYYREDRGLDTCVVRLHNVYGPLGSWEGGKEKAPAAIARKVAGGGPLVLWGDGRQTRSFMFVDDCVEGLVRLMASGTHGPINLGTEELVTVDELARTAQDCAGVGGPIEHDPTKPQGVRGRNSDNSKLRALLGWEPTTTLREGMAKTYPWVAAQVEAARGRR